MRCRHRSTKRRVMTGGMAIVESLIAMGVDQVFGLPGAQLYPLFDALAQRSRRDPHVRRAARADLRLHGVRRGALDGPAGRVRGRAGAGRAQCRRGAGDGAGLLRAGACASRGRCRRRSSAGRGHLHELPDQLAISALGDQVGGADRAAGGCAGGDGRGVAADDVGAARAGRGRDGVGRDGGAASEVAPPAFCCSARAAATRPSQSEIEAAVEADRRARAADDHDRQRRTGCGASRAGAGRVARRAGGSVSRRARRRRGGSSARRLVLCGVQAVAGDRRADRHRHAARDAVHALGRHDAADRQAGAAAASRPHRHRSGRDAAARAACRHRRRCGRGDARC